MTDRDPDENGPELEALRRALRAEYRGRVDVPAEADDALRARTHLPFARIRRRRLLWVAVPAAAAAALVLAVYVGTAEDDGVAAGSADATVALARPSDTAAAAAPQDAPGASEASAPATDAAPTLPAADVGSALGDLTPSTDVATTADATGSAAEAGGEPVDGAPVRTEAGVRRRRDDVNGDGRVNILDAFVLAKALETDGERDGEWDLSGDGRVDGADVELLARAAVSVSGGGK